MPVVEETNDKIPVELSKTFLAALLLLLGFLSSTTSLAFTHERVPDAAPLPDLVLDNLPYQPWALEASEVIIVVSTLSAVVVVLAHTHRLVILRRIWLLMALLYFYRAITVFITVLPMSDPTYPCTPKKDSPTLKDYVVRTLALVSGGGLSINGQQIYCGDFIFSGHTLVLTITCLTITQYSPRRFTLLHWASFTASLAGVVLLMLARGHYSVDVLLAYYVTTRMWWMYHTMANSRLLKTSGGHNQLGNLWWFRALVYFERNVGDGELPRRYSWPGPMVFMANKVCDCWRRLRGKRRLK